MTVLKTIEMEKNRLNILNELYVMETLIKTTVLLRRNNYFLL